MRSIGYCETTKFHPIAEKNIAVAVSEVMRAVEVQIDSEIRSLPIWKGNLSRVLESIMGLYRDAIELTFVRSLDAKLFQNDVDLHAQLVREDRARIGILWVLKWATAYCHRATSNHTISPDDLISAFFLGDAYDVLVDVLKYANLGLVELSVNRESKEITCYEGQNLTGIDAEIVKYQQTIGPTHVHAALTADTDQLTTNWDAGDYRRIVRNLAKFAAAQENRIGLHPEVAEQLGAQDVFVDQPTLVWLDRPRREEDAQLFDSLTVPSKISDEFMWGARSLLETPIVPIGSRFCALSSDLKAISLMDDYMLRLAARLDEKQYSSVSGRREGRMASACRDAFQKSNGSWTVLGPKILTDPAQEADVVASRQGESLVIELKSTLRPEALWEVYKRNQDVVHGVSQAHGLVGRGVADQGLVITDGYRGDYQCWAEALKCGITIGTLDDLSDLASDPQGAIQLMKERAGVVFGATTPRKLPERAADLLGWKILMKDASLGDKGLKR